MQGGSQKMFQKTYPVGAEVVFVLNVKGEEAVGEVLYSSPFFMKVKVTSEGYAKGRDEVVSPKAFIRVKGE